LYLTIPFVALMVTIGFAIGITLLGQGHGLSALPPLLIPLAIGGFWVALVTSGMTSLRQRIQPLLDDVIDLLESPQPISEVPVP
jgi:hypothetical protein